MTRQVRLFAAACGIALVPLVAPAAFAQIDNCPHRGQLDTLYCDQDGDLVADAPTDVRKWRDPSTLVFAYAPVEDPAVYQNIFKPFVDRLGACTEKRVVYFPVYSNAAQVEAMRAGRLHLAFFSAGTTGFAVNLAGAVPFASLGTAQGAKGYHLLALVRSDSPYRKLADLKGKRVAHTSPSSNSGNLAPRVLFAAEGLKPDEDYKPLMSGGHDNSVLGVRSGDYDMAAVASTLFERMAARGAIKREDFRIIFESAIFPIGALAYAHDLKPDLAQKLTRCVFDFAFPASMVTQLDGADRHVPITYRETFAAVRDVAEKSGTPYNKAAYEAEAKREADALAKQQREKTRTPQ